MRQVPEQLTLARQIFFRKIRSKYGHFEYFSVLEFTSKTRLPHLHILARGRYIYQKTLSAYWGYSTQAASIKPSPVVYISKPRNQEFAAFYALSYALSGVEKGQDIPDTWQGRKLTYSSAFFHKPTREIWHEALSEYFGNEFSNSEFEVLRYPQAMESYKENLCLTGVLDKSIL